MFSREGLAWAAMGEWSWGANGELSVRPWASGGHTKQTARYMILDLRELLEKYIHDVFSTWECQFMNHI